jgi:hypothetical protein
MALETLKIIERGLEYYVVDECPRKWERPCYSLLLIIVSCYLKMPLQCPMRNLIYYKPNAVGANRTPHLLITNRRSRYQLQQHRAMNNNIINMLDKIDCCQKLAFAAITYGLVSH